MTKLAVLPGAAAITPEFVVYVRVAADGSAGAGIDSPHSILLRVQGFNEPIPLALHPNREAAEDALGTVLSALTEAGAEELKRLPGGLVVNQDEPVFFEVMPEKTPQGRVFVARVKLETDERPLELGSFASAPEAMKLTRACAESLGDEWVVLDRGVGIKRNKVQRTEVRAERKTDGSMSFTVLLKVQSEPRRLTLAGTPSRQEAIAAVEAVVAAVNEGQDEDEQLKLLPRGFAIRPDGIKGLRVRARREPGPGGQPRIAYAVVVLTEDDEEQVLDNLAAPEEAEALVAEAIEAFNAIDHASEWG